MAKVELLGFFLSNVNFSLFVWQLKRLLKIGGDVGVLVLLLYRDGWMKVGSVTNTSIQTKFLGFPFSFMFQL